MRDTFHKLLQSSLTRMRNARMHVRIRALLETVFGGLQESSLPASQKAGHFGLPKNHGVQQLPELPLHKKVIALYCLLYIVSIAHKSPSPLPAPHCRLAGCPHRGEEEEVGESCRSGSARGSSLSTSADLGSTGLKKK
jgi:hypothetical protein